MDAPLAAACRYGHAEMVDLLIEEGADLEALYGEAALEILGQTVLFSMAYGVVACCLYEESIDSYIFEVLFQRVMFSYWMVLRVLTC